MKEREKNVYFNDTLNTLLLKTACNSYVMLLYYYR